MSLLGTYRPPDTEAELALQDRLRAHVDILAGLIGPRHLGQPSSLDAAAAYIQRQFLEMGDSVTRHTYPVGPSEASNLIAERTGYERSYEIVILGAHYDTVPDTPGADDNASAVAMMIEVARQLRGMRARRTIRFAAFTNEEPPHFYTDTMGSQQYARICRRRGDTIVAMICLEMVGYYSAEAGSQGVPEMIPAALRVAFPKRGDFLAAVGNLRSARLVLSFRRGFRKGSRFPLYAIALPERIHEIRLSDNGSFWDEGYPALMITDTSFLRNPHYHLPSDTPATLDYGRMTMATLGVASAIGHLAGVEGSAG